MPLTSLSFNSSVASYGESASVSARNEPFGSRSEPGTFLIAPILLLPPGEVPEGRARGVQDTATQVQSESEA
jgi:hypothetical protein